LKWLFERRCLIPVMVLAGSFAGGIVSPGFFFRRPNYFSPVTRPSGFAGCRVKNVKPSKIRSRQTSGGRAGPYQGDNRTSIALGLHPPPRACPVLQITAEIRKRGAPGSVDFRRRRGLGLSTPAAVGPPAQRSSPPWKTKGRNSRTLLTDRADPTSAVCSPLRPGGSPRSSIARPGLVPVFVCRRTGAFDCWNRAATGPVGAVYAGMREKVLGLPTFERPARIPIFPRVVVPPQVSASEREPGIHNADEDSRFSAPVADRLSLIKVNHLGFYRFPGGGGGVRRGRQ